MPLRHNNSYIEILLCWGCNWKVCVYKQLISGWTLAEQPGDLALHVVLLLPYAAGQTLRSPGATSKHASFGHAHTCGDVTGWNSCALDGWNPSDKPSTTCCRIPSTVWCGRNSGEKPSDLKNVRAQIVAFTGVIHAKKRNGIRLNLQFFLNVPMQRVV